jgi:hypothetical protein
VIAYQTTLDVPRELAQFVVKLLAAERCRCGTGAGHPPGANPDDECPSSGPGTGPGQKKWKSGWPSCHRRMTTLPMMLEPLMGPQKRLSQEMARLSPIT